MADLIVASLGGCFLLLLILLKALDVFDGLIAVVKSAMRGLSE